MALGILRACCPCAFPLNPSLDVNQYAHTAWKVSEGFSQGVIRAIAQAPDGYLWLGTEFGLLRFDGVRAVPWQPPAGKHLLSSDITSLQVARDGRLWIGAYSGLASWKDGTLTHYPELDGQIIEALLEDREGTIWVGGWAPSIGRLCRIQSGNTQCYGEDGRFGSGVTTLYEDSGGNLWAGGMTGLWRWKPGPPKLYPIADPAHRIYALIESDDGGILIAKHGGMTKLRNGKAEAYPLPAGPQFRPHRLLRDRNGGLWIGAVVDRGLLHIHKGTTDLFTRADGLSGGAVSSLFEDREGNIWVATLDGLDRFRDFAVPTISVQQGLSSQGVAAVLAARDGSLWLGTSNGLNRWNKGQITIYRKRSLHGVRAGSSLSGLTPGRGADSKGMVREITDSGLPDNPVDSLFQDYRGQIWVATLSGVAFFKSDRFVPVGSVPNGVVYSIAADRAGNVWMSHQEALFHLLEARMLERIPWAKLGRREPASALLHDAVQGGLWVGFQEGGVAYFKDGRIRASYASPEGLGDGMVRGFYVDGNGTLWAATEGGLSRIKDGRVLTLTSQNGLPCNTVHWMMEDDAHSVWLYLACGLVRISRSELDAWASHSKQTIQATVFDSSDGVSNHRITSGYSAVVAKSADGRLWFVPFGGVSVIDPQHLAFNKLPPPVHIEQMLGDGKKYDIASGLRLPPLVRNLAFDFVALSLVAPEKNRYRFKLEGWDYDWREAVNEFRVEYTNLPPRQYRFRVIASNNCGVWNETGDTLDFSIAPAYYQTNWFRATLVAAFFVGLWGLYRLRLHQIAREFNASLEGRVDERLRVARDLHDTLLQSFQGLIPVFQTARNLLPGQSDRAADVLDEGLHDAADAIVEGRNAIQNLRAKPSMDRDLGSLLNAAGQELAQSPEAEGSAPAFRVVVEGSRQPLAPLLQDEIYRIGREMLRNAFRHAHAGRIEAEIRYDRGMFRLRIRDDGKGIDSSVLKEGSRTGHWGLPGMHERAKRMGGRLKIWSEPGAGTEAELTVPARIAYEKFSTNNGWWARLGRRLRLTAPNREA
jgi:ligand-binding sensor domain-containing protein/signal transduction histidine kinase